MTTAPAERAALAPDAALDRALRGLGPAWRVVRDTSLADGAGARRPFVAVALLHPALGVALLDLAPRITPDAVGALRAALHGTGLAPPIVHRVLTRDHLARLPDILDYAFGWESPFEAPGAWMDAVAQHLGAAPRLVPPVVATPRPRMITRAIVGGAIALALAGVALLAREPPAPPPVVAVAPPPPQSAARVEEAETPASLLRRGQALLALGDLEAARVLLERAAASGSAEAATALGRSHDPDLLARLGRRPEEADRALAMQWYRTGLARGDAAAGPPLERLSGGR